ncbi:MAG: sigma-70 family RNA polymerase sigma factor [Chloroflexi bacterium]|nr:sigma-70 family RNA polymerase sigma factor [Chloroflexota bacterium]
MHEPPLSASLATTPAAAVPRGAGAALDGAASVDDLARAASAGDAQALGTLYGALVGPISSYVTARLRRREDAEDVTHLVFERIVAALPRYRHDGKPFAAFAFRVARNAVIDHQRRLRPTAALWSIAEPADAIELETLSLRGESIRELHAAIRRLTPDQREALALRYSAGLTAEEAALVMGRRAGTIRGLTFRAIESLRRYLSAEAAESARTQKTG